MKGFIHLLEILVATVLIAVVIAGLFSIRIKENWEIADIISVGTNMMNLIEQNESYFIDIVNEDFGLLNQIKPANVKIGLEIKGSPKSDMFVGCIDVPSCTYLYSLLTPTYVNGRWVNFTLERFDFDAPEDSIPLIYDAVVFVNYTDYSSKKQNISSFLDRGGSIIAINASFNDADFNEIFNLSSAVAPLTYLNFTKYNIYDNKISKYFFGYGFDATTTWTIWGDDWTVFYASNYVNLSRVSDGTNITFLYEGSSFNLNGPGGSHTFKIRRIWPSQRVDIQSIDTSFTFVDFSERNCGGNNILADTSNTIAGMTTNNSAIWISDFPSGDEYRTLLKAVISAGTDNWTYKHMETSREVVELTSFVSLCCDMPGISELVLRVAYIL